MNSDFVIDVPYTLRLVEYLMESRDLNERTLASLVMAGSDGPARRVAAQLELLHSIVDECMTQEEEARANSVRV